MHIYTATPHIAAGYLNADK